VDGEHHLTVNGLFRCEVWEVHRRPFLVLKKIFTVEKTGLCNSRLETRYTPNASPRHSPTRKIPPKKTRTRLLGHHVVITQPKTGPHQFGYYRFGNSNTKSFYRLLKAATESTLIYRTLNDAEARKDILERHQPCLE
jgi:hypothetical protein